jgi:hypothetical protein
MSGNILLKQEGNVVEKVSVPPEASKLIKKKMAAQQLT